MPNVLPLLPLVLAFSFFSWFDGCGGGGGHSKQWTPTPTVGSTATVSPTATRTASRAPAVTATRVPPTASPTVAASPTPTTADITSYRAPAGHLCATNDGYGSEHGSRSLQVIDPRSLTARRLAAEHFFRLAVRPDGQPVCAANGPHERFGVFAVDGTQLARIEDHLIRFP